MKCPMLSSFECVNSSKMSLFYYYIYNFPFCLHLNDLLLLNISGGLCFMFFRVKIMTDFYQPVMKKM